MKPRRPHRLTRPKRRTRPQHVVFVDCETYVDRVEGNTAYHRLRLGWALYQRWRPDRRKFTEHWLYFERASDFWDWVNERTPRGKSLWLMSCNLAFDWTILDGWRFLPLRGAKVNFFYAVQSTTLIDCQGWGRHWRLLDTVNILPQSVAQLGDHVGRPKLDVDWRSSDSELVADHCHRDVEIIRDAFNGWCDFIEVNDYGEVKWTLASQAFTTYRYRFMEQDIFIHGDDTVCRLERAAYFGGRTEAYLIGRYDASPIWVLDVNSMYPHVMARRRYPCRLIGSGRFLPLSSLGPKLKRYMMVARVCLETDEAAFPVRSTRTIFPVGRFVTTLTTPELHYAHERGYVRQVLEWADYEPAELFTPWVDNVMALKERYKREGNSLYAFICKRLGNSLYGKFGQKWTEWIDVGHNGTTDTYTSLYGDNVTGKVGVERCFFGWVERAGDIFEAKDSFPAIAAHVTAYARLLLWDLIGAAGPDNVFYCDTDSLMVTPVGLERLADRIDPFRLGALKLETPLDWLEVFATKDYQSNRAIVLKGVPRKAEEISTGVYRYEQFPGFPTLLRKRVAGEYPITTITKVLKREYLKGDISKTGRVTPYHLNNW